MYRILAVCFLLSFTVTAALEKATVILRVSGCAYFLADGPRGIYVLEWYGGHDPERGETIIGDVGSYGFKDVYYLEKKKEGRLYVDDYLLSKSTALEKLAEKCK